MTSKQYYNLVYSKFLDSDRIMNNVFIRNFHNVVTLCAFHYASVKGCLPFSDDNVVHYPAVKDNIYISKLCNYSSAYKSIISKEIMSSEEYIEASKMVDEYIELYHDKTSLNTELLKDEQDYILSTERVVSISKEMFKK